MWCRRVTPVCGGSFQAYPRVEEALLIGKRGCVRTHARAVYSVDSGASVTLGSGVARQQDDFDSRECLRAHEHRAYTRVQIRVHAHVCS